jgi:amino acid transporter
MSTMDQASSPAPASASNLHRRSLGTADVVFFILAATAPLAVTGSALAVAYLVTGNQGLPFLLIPLGIVLAVFAAGFTAMSRHVADAGAFYTYVVRGLGRIPGVSMAFVAVLSYNAAQMGIYGLFGVVAAGFFSDKIGITLDWYWWCLIGGSIIAVLGALRVDLNAKVLAIALILEILVVAIFDLAVLADPGPQGLSGVGFDPSVATGTALGAALVFCVASFIGFEGAAIYSEETKDPKRTVARATFIAIGIIVVFYAVTCWLLAAAVGPDTMIDPEKLVAGGFEVGGVPDPTTVMIGAGAERLGAFWGDAANLLLVTSLFAALLSFHNAVARYFFALGREKVLPSVLARTNSAGAPVAGSLLQSGLALIVVGVFAVAGADPLLKLFTWLSNMGALGVVFLMAVTSFAVFAFFQRHPDPELSPLRTVVAPLAAGVALLAIVVLGVLNFNVLITGLLDAPTDSMTVTLMVVLLAAAVLGAIVAAVLRSNRPDVYAGIGQPTQTEVIEHVVTD